MPSAQNVDMTYRNDDFSRLEIDLPGCLENYKYFRSKLQDTTRLLVLVKANAYGHGAVEFASLMESAGADYLAVAYPVEGVELRNAGIKSPIMVLTAGTDFFDEIKGLIKDVDPGAEIQCGPGGTSSYSEPKDIKDWKKTDEK